MKKVGGLIMECINCGKQTVPECMYCRECSLAIVTKLLRQYAKSRGNQMISKQEGVIDEREERMREFHKNLDEAQREQEKKDEENGAVFFIAGQKIILSEDYICIKDIVIEAKKILCGNQERFQNNIYGKNIDFMQLMSQADYIQTSYETTVEKLRRLALKHGVKCDHNQILWDINRESGTIWLKSLDDINIIYQEKQKLDDQLHNIDGLLELQKQTRNRVRGYGSGLKGLLKTSIQTSIANNK